MGTPSLTNSVQQRATETVSTRNETELQLIIRARGGDRTALQGLWDDYHGVLNRFFARQIVSREEAEDLTSETLLAVFHNISTFRGITSDSSVRLVNLEDGSDGNRVSGSFHAFVFSIAKNQLRQWLRRKHVRDHRAQYLSTQPHPRNGSGAEPVETVDLSTDPLVSVLRREHLDSACFALAGVGIRSCEQFKALLFHYGCGLAHKEIAELLSTRKETINTRLQEGRTTLKAHYSTRPGS